MLQQFGLEDAVAMSDKEKVDIAIRNAAEQAGIPTEKIG